MGHELRPEQKRELESSSLISEKDVKDLLKDYEDKGLRETLSTFFINLSNGNTINFHKFKTFTVDGVVIPIKKYIEMRFAEIEEKGEEVEKGEVE